MAPHGKAYQKRSLLVWLLLPTAVLLFLWTGVGDKRASAPPAIVLQKLQLAATSLRQACDRALRGMGKAGEPAELRRALASLRALAGNVTRARGGGGAAQLPLLLVQALLASRDAVASSDVLRQRQAAAEQAAGAAQGLEAAAEALRAERDAAAGERDTLRHERNLAGEAVKAAREEAQRLKGELAALEAEAGQCRSDRNSAAEALKGARRGEEECKAHVKNLAVDMETTMVAEQRALAAHLAQPAVRERWAREVQALAPRGIVVSAAGVKPLTNAFVALYVLRHTLNCSLPITISFWGEIESISDKARAFFQKHVGGVSFLDLSKLPYPPAQRPVNPKRVDGGVSGFKIKAYAIYAAPYQEFIALDSDSTALVNPEELFASEVFQKHGCMFFPDIYNNGVELYRHFNLTDPWPGIWWINPDLPNQMESGQMLINRTRHQAALEWVLFLNTHNDLVYNQMAYGDKDTFRAAFDLAGARDDFYQRPDQPVLGLYDTKTETPRYRYSILLQLDPLGRAAFAHRAWIMKYDISDNKGRPTSHVALPSLGKQQDKLLDQWGWREEEVLILPPEQCAFEEADVLGSGQRCEAARNYSMQAPPTPCFPLQGEGGHLSRGLRASEEAFRLLLRSWEEEGPVFT